MAVLCKRNVVNAVELSLRLALTLGLLWLITSLLFTQTLLPHLRKTQDVLELLLPRFALPERPKLAKLALGNIFPPTLHPFTALCHVTGVTGVFWVTKGNKTSNLGALFVTAVTLACGQLLWTLGAQRIADTHFAMIACTFLHSLLINCVIAFVMCFKYPIFCFFY